MPTDPGRSRRAYALAVLAITAVGIAFRLARLDETLLGDELSTLFIVDGNGLGDVLSDVSSDAEISPPGYFVLAWLATQLGSASELVRLPSLLAGIASIPLTFVVGARTIGWRAGLLGSLVMALSPFMIFYSTDGRAYAVTILLLLISTLAMLSAVSDGRARWWIAYGAASCLAMYMHYTAAFVLGAQLIWLVWAHPHARRPALIANVVAAVFFLPWIGGLISDTDSPTVDILSTIQGDGLDTKLEAVAVWIVGLPYVELDQVPGVPALVVLLVALLVALVASAIRSWEPERRLRLTPSRGAILVAALCVSTPLAEAVLLNLGITDLFGARNLNASSAGLALAIGGAVAAAGPRLAPLLAAVVIGCYSVAAVKVLNHDNQLVGANSAAEFIDAEAGPSDVVVDAVTFTPVPLTPLDASLPQTRPEYRLNLPEGEPPFLPYKNQIPDSGELLAEAFEEARGNRLFLLARSQIVPPGPEYPNGGVTIATGLSEDPGPVYPLPPGTRIVDSEEVPGYLDAVVTVIEVR